MKLALRLAFGGTLALINNDIEVAHRLVELYVIGPECRKGP
jgi:hypothetical protein